MSLWIKPSQTVFVEKKRILKKIYTTQEAMYWATNSNQKLIIIILDFEKAYDRVSWIFLKYALTPKLLWPIFCLFLKFGQPIFIRVLMLNY